MRHKGKSECKVNVKNVYKMHAKICTIYCILKREDSLSEAHRFLSVSEIMTVQYYYPDLKKTS